MHALFFLGGWSSVDKTTLQNGNLYFFSGGLFGFSLLCSILVLITWLIFYLRNNAFKSFYRLGKWHLTKEFLLILPIVFTAITFFESYGYGERVKVRSITSYTELVKEVNTINLAKAFIPTEKNDYFVFSSCGYEGSNSMGYAAAIDYDDTINNDSKDPNFIRIRKALKEDSGFSYKYYCRTMASLDDTLDYYQGRQVNAVVNKWLQNKQKDSVAAIITQLMAICKKYDIDINLNPTELANLPFMDSNHTVSRLVRTGNSVYPDVNAPLSPYWLDIYSLNRVTDYMDRCSDHNRNKGHWERVLGELYFMLGIALLLLCYRRFSKKVFLISVVGAVVWCILLALMAAAIRSEMAFGILYLFLFVLFSILALAGLYSKRTKVATGVLLNWHIYMAPTVLLAIAFLIAFFYQDAPQLYGVYDSARHCMDYPIGCWVDNNIETIAWGNLIVSLLYITFIFNRFTKKWHIMPEE